MTDLNEEAVELNLIALLKTQGYDFFAGAMITPHGNNPHDRGLIVLF